ncbi:MAG: DUF1292 domain-containing protein [Bacilli bacterium]|nr:DUF1292 domain-containing protein [Bacilli bacterium]
MELNENQIAIYDEDGNKFLMEILFTYENEERGAKYVFVYENNAPDDIYLMKYDDNGNITPVEDEEEFEEGQEVLAAFEEDPNIEKLKNS